MKKNYKTVIDHQSKQWSYSLFVDEFNTENVNFMVQSFDIARAAFKNCFNIFIINLFVKNIFRSTDVFLLC